jgi:hypothetical protein
MSVKILETNNYSLFVLSPFNRDVKKTRWLRESLLEYGYLDAYPLDVRRIPNGKLEIRDGHHRFTVAQGLGIPVKYVESKDGATIQDLVKTIVPWNVWDTLTGHVRTGKAAYVKLYNYHKETGIPISSCISLLTGNSAASSSNHLQHFKEGTYSLGDLTQAKIVGEIIIHCQAHGVPFARNNYFVQAVSKISFAEGFDQKVMLNKIATFPEFMTKQPSKQAYVKMLDEVYNRKSQKKIPLEFQANEAARERCAALAVPEKFSGTSKGKPRKRG